MAKRVKTKNSSVGITAHKPSQQDNVIFVLLMILLGFVPLLVRVVEINDYSPIISSSILDTGVKYDISTYYKFAVNLIGATAVTLLYLYKILAKKSKIEIDYTSIPLAALYLFILISALTSDLKTISLFGFFDIHEGTLAFLSCMILFFAAANLKYTEKMLQTVVYGLYPLIFINAGLSLLAFYGVNVLQWPVVKGMILPSELMKAGGLSADSVLQSTLSNPNYVSGLGGVLTVFFLVRGILAEEKRPAITNFVMAAVSFSMVITAKSTSGFLTLVVMLPFTIYFIYRTQSRVQRAAGLGLTLVGFALILAVFTLHDPLAWSESMGFFTGSSAVTTVTQPANAVTDKQSAAILDPNDELYLPPKSLSAGNGRFYIWGKTLELIKKRPVTGYGLDTLAYYFPQHDKEKITQDLGRDDMTQKPHNLYLGIAFGSGLLALGAFVFLLSNHLIANVRLLWGSMAGQKNMIASLFTAWLAFLIQGMFNDFTIATSVIFWILFGVGVSLCKEQLKVLSK